MCCRRLASVVLIKNLRAAQENRMSAGMRARGY